LFGTAQQRDRKLSISACRFYAGQGIGLFSNVLVAPELKAGTLLKAFDVSLPGYHYYLAHQPNHSREKIIKAFST
jgi:LysR family transcriptional regulator, glycine cleavage system transcriptional activator